jgi:hypothetical protein
LGRQQQSDRPPCGWISLWEGGASPRPALKGVLKVSVEDIQAMLAQAYDQGVDDYGQMSLDIALWEEEDGGGNYPILKGKLTVRQEREEKKPKRGSRTRR